MEIRHLEWEDIEDIMFDITVKLKKFGDDTGWKPDMVVGIVRGGAIPAVMLSHTLNIPCDMMLWQTRDGGLKDHRMDVVDYDILQDKKNVLLVDDINDSGLTFQSIVDDWCYFDAEVVKQHVVTCALFERYNSKFKADICGVYQDDDTWISYPWENN